MLTYSTRQLITKNNKLKKTTLFKKFVIYFFKLAYLPNKKYFLDIKDSLINS